MQIVDKGNMDNNTIKEVVKWTEAGKERVVFDYEVCQGLSHTYREISLYDEYQDIVPYTDKDFDFICKDGYKHKWGQTDRYFTTLSIGYNDDDALEYIDNMIGALKRIKDKIRGVE